MWRAPGRTRSSRSRACPGPARCPTRRPPRSRARARRPPAGPTRAWPTASSTTRAAVRQPLAGPAAADAMNAPPRCKPARRYRWSPSARKLGDVDRDLDKPKPGQPSQQHPGPATVEIVTRARVTRGVLHHRFRDKTDLFGAVMQTVAGELAQRLI